MQVTFSRIPYATVIENAKRQDALVATSLAMLGTSVLAAAAIGLHRHYWSPLSSLLSGIPLCF